MNKDALLSVQNKIAAIKAISYVDEDWGQLDEYATHPPVQWPCCLIDITGATFSNIGIDKRAVPMNRQEGTGTLVLTFARMKLTNTSGKSPLRQKEKAWELLDVIDDVHALLQGWRPLENWGVLIRSSYGRVKRADGIQMYRVTYTFGAHNV